MYLVSVGSYSENMLNDINICISLIYIYIKIHTNIFAKNKKSINLKNYVCLLIQKKSDRKASSMVKKNAS